MALHIDKELEQIQKMTVSELRERYFELFGTYPHSFHRQHLARELAWKIQAQEYGGLPEDVRQYALGIARTLPVRARIALNRERRARGEALPDSITSTVHSDHDSRVPMPGSLVVREYRGETHVVRVLDDGFEYAGRRFASLSSIAREITGTKWNGYTFFGLT